MNPSGMRTLYLFLFCLLACSVEAKRINALQKQVEVKDKAEEGEGDGPNLETRLHEGKVYENDQEMTGLIAKAYEMFPDLQDKMFKSETGIYTKADCCCCHTGVMSTGCDKDSDGLYQWIPTKMCYNFTQKDSDGGEEITGFGSSWSYKCKGRQDDQGFCFHYETGNGAQARKRWFRKMMNEAQEEDDAEDKAAIARWKAEEEAKWAKGKTIEKHPVVHGITALAKDGIITQGCKTDRDTCWLAFPGRHVGEAQWESFTREQLEAFKSPTFSQQTTYTLEGMFDASEWEDDWANEVKALLKKGKP